ncbi:MAG: hypothetical protein HOP08_18735 [Cyclobacteriaceae bacterium]|nr:hypothetical protein [Cyclobacteriaceae bacterium]
MKFSVFYSWQSDLPNNSNRTAIQTAIEKAIKNVQKDEVDLEIAIDRDTSGVSGSPDIANTIFDKIKSSQIFVGDISIINSHIDQVRKTPNPNVLIELGYAASQMSWSNVISVFNEAYGKVDDLPFDLKARRLLIYSLKDSIGSKDVLQARITEAITAIIGDYKNQNRIYYGRWSATLGQMSTEQCIDVIKKLHLTTILKKGKNEVRMKIGSSEFLSLKNYIFFATPTRLGRAVAGVSNIDGGFDLVGEKIRVDSDQHSEMLFDLYQSTNALHGDMEFQVRFYDLQH